MKKAILLIMFVGMVTTVFGQREIRRVNVSDSVEIVIDSTYIVNDELKGVFYQVWDLSPRIVERNYITKPEVENVIAQLELEFALQSQLAKTQRKFIDSLQLAKNLPDEGEWVRRSSDIIRIKNEIKMWKKILRKFEKTKAK